MLFILALIVAVIAFFVWNGAKARTRDVPVTPATVRLGAAGVGIFFLVIAFLQILVVIPAGHVGVVDLFGRVASRPLHAGINFRNPLARIIMFSIKTQDLMEVMEVPSKEGLTVTMDASVLYHLDPEKAPEVYRTVGQSYTNIILVPQFRSVCRGVTAGYEAKALYTSQREAVGKEIQAELVKLVGPRGIIIENAPLRKVGLPVRLSDAIEEKLRAEQESQRMEFVLTKEKQEAERKRIEARGIADFQDIVTKGISEPLLRWKGIEATEKLAVSSNAKVVIIGAGKDGLPVILDTK